MTYQFRISDPERVEAIKREFVNHFGENQKVLTTKEAENNMTEITLTDLTNLGLLCLFHAGIMHGMLTMKKTYQLINP